MTEVWGFQIWYDGDGRPIGQREAEQLLLDFDARRVALEQIGPYRVSTVHLVSDHSFFDGGPPLIFETMIFDEEGGEVEHVEQSCWRTPNRTAALAAHDQAVAMVREAAAAFVTPSSEGPTAG